MHAAKLALYMAVIHRLAALIPSTKERSMTDMDTPITAPTATVDEQPETQIATGSTTSEPDDDAATNPTPVEPAPAVPAPKCTATATASGDTPKPESSQPTPDVVASATVAAPQTDQPSPFIETAMAAAKLIELLRQHPEAHGFLEALLKCLKPAKTSE